MKFSLISHNTSELTIKPESKGFEQAPSGQISVAPP
jgi:hypothetical protein